MTVAELIERLKAMPQDENVVYSCDEHDYDINDVELYDGNKWKQVELS